MKYWNITVKESVKRTCPPGWCLKGVTVCLHTETANKEWGSVGNRRLYQSDSGRVVVYDCLSGMAVRQLQTSVAETSTLL